MEFYGIRNKESGRLMSYFIDITSTDDNRVGCEIFDPQDEDKYIPWLVTREDQAEIVLHQAKDVEHKHSSIGYPCTQNIVSPETHEVVKIKISVSLPKTE